MTVSEMIEWLKTQDQEATVEVVVRVPATGWEGDSVRIVDFIPEEYSYYTDMRGNQFAKGTSYENDRTLLLGSD